MPRAVPTPAAFAAAVAESEGDIRTEDACAALLIERYADYASARAGESVEAEDMWNGLAIALDGCGPARKVELGILIGQLIVAEAAGLLPAFAAAVKSQLEKHDTEVAMAIADIYRRTT